MIDYGELEREIPAGLAVSGHPLSEEEAIELRLAAIRSAMAPRIDDPVERRQRLDRALRSLHPYCGSLVVDVLVEKDVT